MKMYNSAVITKTIQACKFNINFEHTIQVFKRVITAGKKICVADFMNIYNF